MCAESPDRIFIGVRGEIKAPEKPPRGFNGSWGSTGQRATEPPAETRNSIVVVDRNGKLIESWTQWDTLRFMKNIGAMPEPAASVSS